MRLREPRPEARGPNRIPGGRRPAPLPGVCRRLGRRGSSLVDPLVALAILGLGAIALSSMLLSVAGGARAAALEGRRAALAQRTMDYVRSGMASADEGVLLAWPDGEAYEAVWARRDDVAQGSIEISVASLSGGGAFVLGAARPDP